MTSVATQSFPAGGPGCKNAAVRSRVPSVVLLLCLIASACSSDPQTESTPTTATRSAVDQSVERFRVEVLQTVPHDPAAFTQGLLIDDGVVFESTGRYGTSTLREVDLASGEVQRSVPVDETLFAEGLELVDGRLIQLTWKAGRALVYEAETFALTDEFTYDTEGWGLCELDLESSGSEMASSELAMSDGTSTITFRSPDSFEALRTITVRQGGTLVTDINELECVGGAIWANIWQTDTIVRIDPTTGSVTGVVDAAGLLTADEAERADVLNGIAYNEADNTFWITGKWWPNLFQVRFEPVSGE